MAEKFNEKDKKLIFNTLKKYATPHSIKSLSEIEGMLVGSLCASEPVGMQEILNIIWGEDKNNHPDWDTDSEVELFFDSLSSLLNKNKASLQRAHYKPQILKEKKYYKRWCSGFVKGTGGADVLGSLTEDLPNHVVLSGLSVLVLSELMPPAPALTNHESFQDFLCDVRDGSLMMFGSKIKSLVDYYYDSSESMHVHTAQCSH